ncbi:hypothetical protein CK623_06090, partial [Vandammella animalimorsus]
MHSSAPSPRPPGPPSAAAARHWPLWLALPLALALALSLAQPLVLAAGRPLPWAAPLWGGLCAALVLAYAAAMLPSQPWQALPPGNVWTARHPWLTVSAGACWMAACQWALLQARPGLLLSLLLPWLCFSLAWQAIGAGSARQRHFRLGLLLAQAGWLLLIAYDILLHPWRLQRLWESLLATPLPLRHAEHLAVLQAWGKLPLLGPASQPLPAAPAQGLGGWLLQAMATLGRLPSAVLAAALLLAWHALWRWLRRQPCHGRYTPGMRRAALGLTALHAAACGWQVLFSFGLLPQRLGAGLPPLSPHPAWWPLSALLAWLLWRAARARPPQPAGSPAAPESAATAWAHRAIATLGYALLALPLGGLLLAGAHEHWLRQRRHLPAPPSVAARLPIEDAAGQIIARDVLAYDLWFTPQQFWGHSLRNPGAPGPASGGLADHQRQLLDALAPWPAMQTVAAARLGQRPAHDSRPAILAWAMPPEAARRIQAQGLPGLTLRPRAARHYPQGPLYAHAIGFASLATPVWGQEGLERRLNPRLHTRTAAPGAYGPRQRPVRTTLQPALQQAARQALQAAMRQPGAVGGAVVLIDHRANAIAALVSAPDFDPNDPASYRNPYQPQRILNRATALPFPAGPLLAPLLHAQALEAGQPLPRHALPALAARLGLAAPAPPGEPLQARFGGGGQGGLHQLAANAPALNVGGH